MRLQSFLACVTGAISVLTTVKTCKSATTLEIRPDDHTAALANKAVPGIGDKGSVMTFTDRTMNTIQFSDAVNKFADVAERSEQTDCSYKMMAREEDEPVGVFQPRAQADNSSVHYPALSLEAGQTQNDTTHAEAISTVFMPTHITGIPNAHVGQIDNKDGWCCVVNKGVKFCFPIDCPSATSATEVSLLPRAMGTATATMTMTYDMRTPLAPRIDDETDQAGALCCFTTGFIVFGCYLCHSPTATPSGIMVNPPASVDVWELEGTSGDIRSRYVKSRIRTHDYSVASVKEYNRVVCIADGPGRLVCQ